MDAFLNIFKAYHYYPLLPVRHSGIEGHTIDNKYLLSMGIHRIKAEPVRGVYPKPQEPNKP